MKVCFTLIINFALFTFSSCTEKSVPLNELTSESLSYCYYNEGLYWVYQNENLDLDTLEVIKSERITEQNESNTLEVEGAYNFIKSSRRPDDQFELHLSAKNGDLFSFAGGVYKSQYLLTWKEYFDKGPETHVGSTLFESDSSIVYTNFHDSLIILDNIYFQVKQFDIGVPRKQYPHSKVYWAKNVGRVQIENQDGSIWKLKSHHLIN